VFCSLPSFLDAIKLWLLLVSPTFNGFLLLYQMCRISLLEKLPQKKKSLLEKLTKKNWLSLTLLTFHLEDGARLVLVTRTAFLKYFLTKKKNNCINTWQLSMALIILHPFHNTCRFWEIYIYQDIK